MNTSEAALRSATQAFIDHVTENGALDESAPYPGACIGLASWIGGCSMCLALFEAMRLAARATSEPGAALESFVKSLGPNPYHPENDINEVWALVEPKVDRLEALGALYELASRAYQAGRAAATPATSEPCQYCAKGWERFEFMGYWYHKESLGAERVACAAASGKGSEQ